MKTTDARNHGRAPGMTVLGIPMPQSLKDQIKTAADHERRTMADWARLELEKAAEAVIAAHFQPVLKVAEGNASSLSTPAHGARPVKYPAGRTRKKA